VSGALGAKFWKSNSHSPKYGKEKGGTVTAKGRREWCCWLDDDT